MLIQTIGSSGTVKLAKKEAAPKSATVAKPAAAKVLAHDPRMLFTDQAKTITEGESHQTQDHCYQEESRRSKEGD